MEKDEDPGHEVCRIINEATSHERIMRALESNTNDDLDYTRSETVERGGKRLELRVSVNVRLVVKPARGEP
jgi:hypothetical protein